MKNNFLTVSFVIFLSGCFSPVVEKTFSSNGDPSYLISCPGGIVECTEAAGNVCQTHGYIIINQSKKTNLLVKCK